MVKLKGNCECKKVSFEINQEIKYFSHCHCSQCRRSHGSAFGSFIEVDSSSFSTTQVKKILNLILHLNYARDYFVRIVVQILCSLMGVSQINITFQLAL